jgi:hypothetical protein
MKEWLGLLWLVIFFWNGVVIVRRQRRSRAAQNYGHPVLDQFLLFVSGALVAGGALGTAWHFNGWSSLRDPRSAMAFELSLLALATALTYASNHLLRRRSK